MAERRSVPLDNFELFRTWLVTHAKVYGVRTDMDVAHHIDMLVESLERYLFETSHKGKNRRRRESERRRFVAIFQRKFLEMTDLEYPKEMTPVDMRAISIVCEKLEGKGCTVEQYLAWLFDDFLPDNEQFCPPYVKFACSDYAVTTFLFKERDVIRERRKNEQVAKEEQDLLRRARVLVRTTKDESVVVLLKRFAEGGIMMSELRKEILQREAVYEKAQRGK